MNVTIEELKEYLATNVDEVTLIELLGVTTEDLVYHLHDVIEDKYDKLIEEYGLCKDENDD